MSDATGRELHELLRELVDRQGAGVVESAEAFRGALDDFLTEDEASLGELNLLADAVRLGAVTRLTSLLAHGGNPEAAVREAGDALARDRGTDDPIRSRWAVAAIGYALGGPAPGTRSVLGLGTGQRNVAAALIIATQNFTDPGVVVMLLVSTIAGLVVLAMPAGSWPRRLVVTDQRAPCQRGSLNAPRRPAGSWR